jgi:acyl-CoA synthetase (AMP-forming)/AMP-acid ligase II
MSLKPDFNSIVDAALYREVHMPDEVVFEFVDSKENRDQITFSVLSRKARSIAAALEHVTVKGDRVLVPTNNHLDFHIAFLGCLYAGRIAVPVAAPWIKRREKDLGFGRLHRILSDCSATAALWNDRELTRLQPHFAQDPYLSKLAHIPVSSAILETPVDIDDIETDPDDVAFLQYSSGSTSSPKGIVLTHHNIVHNQSMLQLLGKIPDDGGMVSWLPLFHDMGLSKGFFFPLYKGVPCTLMSPATFVINPAIWLKELSRRPETFLVSAAPNFAFDLCVQKVSDEVISELDLSRWIIAMNGAEKISTQTLQRFTDRFASAGFKSEYFHPAYGLAEITVFASSSTPFKEPVVGQFCKRGMTELKAIERLESKNTVSIVGCGMVPDSTLIKIVNPELNTLLEDGCVGEIWISSESVGLGYWGNSEETQRVFNFTLEQYPGRKFLKTGDLGFMLNEELFLSGRIKEMIIINGANHYPSDIEEHIQNTFEDARSIAAVSVTASSQTATQENELAVVVEFSSTKLKGDLARIAKEIQQSVYREFRISVKKIYLVQAGKIPRTSSGKIQRILIQGEINDESFSYVYCYEQDIVQQVA